MKLVIALIALSCFFLLSDITQASKQEGKIFSSFQNIFDFFSRTQKFWSEPESKQFLLSLLSLIIKHFTFRNQ